MTRTNTLEMASFTPIESVELNAVEGGNALPPGGPAPFHGPLPLPAPVNGLPVPGPVLPPGKIVCDPIIGNVG
jgi:hypothetical protein